MPKTSTPEPIQHLPGDFCRTCKGRGYLSDEEYRDGRIVTVSAPCWACNGSGWGK